MKKLLFLCLMLYFSSCATSGKFNPYGDEYSFKASSDNLVKSSEKIDNYTTYEVFFTLHKRVKCISLAISSSYITDRIDNNRKIIKSYFIVERMIDVSSFDQQNQFKYTELGRNYDLDWKRKQLIILCNKENDPIYKLKPGLVYRVRFTPFIEKKTDFNIIVSAKKPVSFFKSLADYKNSVKKKTAQKK